MIELTIIGRTGEPEPGGACSCYLVRGEGATLVLDFGPGSHSRLGLHQSPESVDAILISHMHQDHMLDLLPLTRTLRALGAPGLVEGQIYGVRLSQKPEVCDDRVGTCIE